MKKVAIFGNTGAGKSTLAKELAVITSLPLITIDKIQYRCGGVKVPHAEYLKVHKEILISETWILDGFGCYPSAWERFAAADTLIYIDLPLWVHCAWVTKRFFKGLFVNPEGWPKDSPIMRSTITSYRVLWLCHVKLTPRYRHYVAEAAGKKEVIHLRSAREIETYLESLRHAESASTHHRTVD